MQRSLAWLLYCLLPLATFADGMVVPTVAFPAKVAIPDQRALIHFTNGTERLVIETRFTGSGTNFAWVIPLPQQPMVEPASTGLFPTLQHLFQPRIIHDVPQYYLGVLAVLGALWLLRLATRSVSDALVIAAYLLLLMVLLAFFLPALATARHKGGGSAATQPEVSILDRRIAGVFETTTITARDSNALQTWLRENGYALSTTAGPVLANYVKEGWVFVAAKVRRDTAAAETSTPHPLSFTFRTDKPVYPMRLTGVDNGPLEVELYVFGPARASAPHFKTERCTRPGYPEVPSPGPFGAWYHWSPASPDIVHPLLRQWVDGSPVATKLTAHLSPRQMREEVWIDWTPFQETKTHWFSPTGALIYALNWASGFFAFGLCVAAVLVAGDPARRWKFSRLARLAAALSIALGSIVFLALPKTEVRLVRFPRGASETALYDLSCWIEDMPATNLAAIRAEARRILSNPTNDVTWARYASRVLKEHRDWLGGSIHEEDSPGNYVIRENDGVVTVTGYDAQGAEHVLAKWNSAASP